MSIQDQITLKLKDSFQVDHLDVLNESHMHNVPAGSESHFKVTLVSQDFAGLRKIQQHQAVYAVLKEELEGPVHALALHTYDPDTWEQTGKAPDSPNCMGGHK